MFWTANFLSASQKETGMPKRDGFDPGVPSWVDLTTTDEEAARNFYGELFGWEWAPSDTPQGGTYWMANLDGVPVAGLSSQQQESAGQGIPSTWNTYINVDNADKTTAKAVAAGAQVVAPPTDIGDSGRMSIVRDPSGAVIGMWQPGRHKGAGLVNEPGALVWNEVYAPDTGATVAFYNKVFGWEGASLPGGGDYTTFKLGDALIGGTAPPSMGQPPQWQVWFGTADVDATVAKASELGATVLVAATDSPIGRFAFFRDPTGAAFSVITAGQSS
jgi:predicted enzyme related to lactoylglutathione lyase